MTQPFDEQLRRAFDLLADQLRATVSDHASASVEHLGAIIAAAQRQAVDAATRAATEAAEQSVAARLEAECAQREAAARQQGRRDGYDQGLQEARAEALAIQEAHEAIARLTAESSARTAEEQAAQAADALAQANAHAENAVRARAALERLLGAVRALDEATSLSQTLDGLSTAARSEAERVAVFLVRGDVLRAWGQTGFTTLGENAAELPLATSGVIAAAARTGNPQRTAGAAGRPAFAGAFAGGAFVAVPLTMNGQVIAVLCGEQPSATDEGEWLAWTYDVLARHAARVLESLTALRLAQLGTPAAVPAASPL